MIEVSEDRFAELVEAAFAAVPDELAALLDNVVLFIEDDAPADDPTLLGLYDGIPLTERDSTYAGAMPDRIFVYRNPTLEICDTEEDVVEEVKGVDADDFSQDALQDQLDQLGTGSDEDAQAFTTYVSDTCSGLLGDSAVPELPEMPELPAE